MGSRERVVSRASMNESLVLIIHNVRSAHNVGSLFRTADGAGADRIILSGYTPIPSRKDALSLTPAEKAFRKTALGAGESVPWRRSASLGKALIALKKEGFEIVALEQYEKSVDYRRHKAKRPVALLVGNEVRGLNPRILKRCDTVIEIPMHGEKNSLNVAVAAGVALYQITSTMREGEIKI